MFCMNQNCTMMKFRRALQNFGGFIFVQLRWGFFSGQKSKIIDAGKRFGGSSAVIRFCMMN